MHTAYYIVHSRHHWRKNSREIKVLGMTTGYFLYCYAWKFFNIPLSFVKRLAALINVCGLLEVVWWTRRVGGGKRGEKNEAWLCRAAWLEHSQVFLLYCSWSFRDLAQSRKIAPRSEEGELKGQIPYHLFFRAQFKPFFMVLIASEVESVGFIGHCDKLFVSYFLGHISWTCFLYSYILLFNMVSKTGQTLHRH